MKAMGPGMVNGRRMIVITKRIMNITGKMRARVSIETRETERTKPIIFTERTYTAK